jgi:Glycosyl hydrolases family 18
MSRLLLALAALPQLARAAFFSMPWLCLERCGDSSADIAAQLAQLGGPHKADFTAASFELFNLGPNSTLIVNNLTNVAAQLDALGLQTHAMVSSYPYPPEFLVWMRQVFADPQPFVDAVVAAAKKWGLAAINIDWEPTDKGPKPTKQDAADYAAFLDTLACALHEHGLLLSVDVATWSDIWDLALISATRVDFIANMETYVTDDDLWLKEFQASLALIPRSKLVVGLQNHEASVNSTGLKLRFDAMASASPPVRQIGIWRAGIEDSWLPFLDAFAAAG